MIRLIISYCTNHLKGKYQILNFMCQNLHKGYTLIYHIREKLFSFVNSRKDKLKITYSLALKDVKQKTEGQDDSTIGDMATYLKL